MARITVLLHLIDSVRATGIQAGLPRKRFVVVGADEDVLGALQGMKPPRRVDVVLLDLEREEVRSPEFWGYLHFVFSGAKVIALADRSDEFIPWEALCAGVDGLLVWNRGMEAIQNAIEAVVRGQRVYHAEHFWRLKGLLLAPAQPHRVSVGQIRLDVRLSGINKLLVQELLTNREMEVLKLLGEGLTNRRIAYLLVITESTVSFHVRNIVSKLGATSRHQAGLLGLLLD